MHHSNNRRGIATLVSLLVVLLVVIGIGALGRFIVLGQRIDRSFRQQVQANALADSAINRALQQIESDPNYAGDQWQVHAPLPRPGEVDTTVRPDVDGVVIIRSVASYPSDALAPRRAVREYRYTTEEQNVQ